MFEQMPPRSEITWHGNMHSKPAHIESTVFGLFDKMTIRPETSARGMFEQPPPRSEITRHGIYAVLKCVKSSGALAQKILSLKTNGLQPETTIP